MTYLTDFAILRAVEKSNCPSRYFYTNNSYGSLPAKRYSSQKLYHQNKTVVVDSRSYGEAHLTKFLRLK
nr:MAG TPA: hypothetical protein [Caudoviricetes sp.]